MKLETVLAILSLSILFSCATQTDTGQAETSAQSGQSGYDQLVRRCLNGQTIDFTELRWAYRDSRYYQVYGSEAVLELRDLYHNNQLTDAVAIIEREERAHLGNLEFVYLAFSTYSDLGDKENSDFYSSVYLGMVQSIADSGDGKTPQTAFKIILPVEEFIFMNTVGIDFMLQDIVEINGHVFDKFKTLKNANWNSDVIFFNYDTVLEAYNKDFSQ